MGVIKIFIANDKGGVGKSLVAQFCVLALDANGLDPDIIEYDNQPKMRSMFGADRVETNSIGLSADGSQDKDEGVVSWDPLLENLLSNNSFVVDFGAQAWAGFSEWAESIDLGQYYKGKGLSIIVPVTADREALNGAIRVLKSARELLPAAKIHVLKVNKDGDVDDLEGIPEYKMLFTMVETCKAKVKDLPTLRAKGLPVLFSLNYSLDRIVNTPLEDLPLGDLPTASRARLIASVKDWLGEANKVLLSALISVKKVGGTRLRRR